MTQFGAYLKREKVFIQDPFKAKQFMDCVKKAREIFPDLTIEIHDDPIQMGAQILAIEGDYMSLVSPETEAFANIIALADCFEIYPKGDGIYFSAVFQEVLKRIK